MAVTEVLTCLTCDGYEFVPAGDGSDTLVSCPDCPPKERCIVHGQILTPARRCRDCLGEARNAVPLVVLFPDLLRARASSASPPVERSVA